LALDYIYPGELANWSLWLQTDLPVTPWSETAERQSGRFQIVRELGDAALQKVIATVCQPGCLKQRLWPAGSPPLNAPLDEIPLICPEACNFLVSQAREKMKGPDSLEGQPPA